MSDETPEPRSLRAWAPAVWNVTPTSGGPWAHTPHGKHSLVTLGGARRCSAPPSPPGTSSTETPDHAK